MTTAHVSPVRSSQEIAVFAPDQLDPGAAALISQSLSPRTIREYRRWVKDYDEWCRNRGCPPVPATAEQFANYVTDLAARGKGVPTVQMAMAAVRYAHKLAGYDDLPHTGKALQAFRGYRKAVADERRKQATPILFPDLCAILDACPVDTWQGARDRALMLIGWTGMFRRSELEALNWRDVQEHADGLTVYVAQSKTDKDARGAEVNILPGTRADTDPVRVLAAYRDQLSARSVAGGRLFRAQTRRRGVASCITGDQINDVVRAAVKRANLPNPDGYSAHSLRAGGATAAYRNGAPVSAIAAQGRWAPNSPVVLGYIRAVDKWRDHPMRGIGL